MVNYPLEIRMTRAKLDLVIVLLAKNMNVSNKELDELYKIMLHDEASDGFSFEAISKKLPKKEKVPVKNVKEKKTITGIKPVPKEVVDKSEGKVEPNDRK